MGEKRLGGVGGTIGTILRGGVELVDERIGELGEAYQVDVRARIVAVRDQMLALTEELNEPPDVSHEEHVQHCELAGCKHPPVYAFEDRFVQGWCARCRAVAFGGAYGDIDYDDPDRGPVDGTAVRYADGRIVDAETGEALP
jgi:hypothetical protein